MKALPEAQKKEIINVGTLHETLDIMHEEVHEGNRVGQTRAQRSHNDKSDVLPSKISVADYVMIHTHAKRGDKFQSKWHGPMYVKEAK